MNLCNLRIGKEIKVKKSLLGKILQNHSLAMILCCAIPLALIVILSMTGTLGSWGFYALMLLCPVLHIVMMRGHTSSHNHISGLLPAPETIRDERKGGE